MSADLIKGLRAHVATLEAEAEKWRRALAALEESETGARSTKRASGKKDAPKTAKGKPGPKPGRRGETANPPTSGGERAKTRRRVSDILEKHPDATAKEIGEMLGMKPNSVAYHLKALR